MAVDPEVWAVDVVRLGGMGRAVDGWADDPASAPVLACVLTELPYDPEALLDPPAPLVRFGAVLSTVLGRVARPLLDPVAESALDALVAGDPDLADRARALGPALAHRLAFALGTAIELGHLDPVGAWVLHLVDPDGLRTALLGPVLDLLVDVGGVAGLVVAPTSVGVARGTFSVVDEAYVLDPTAPGRGVPDLWVEVDADGEALDPADDAAAQRLAVLHDAPSVLVRPAPPATPVRTPVPRPVLPARSVEALAARVGDGAEATSVARLLACEPAPPTAVAWAREQAAAARAVDPASALAAVAAAGAEVQAAQPAARDRWAAALRVGGPSAPAGHLVHQAGLARRNGRPAWTLDVWAVADDEVAALLARAALDDVEAGLAVDEDELDLALAQRLARVSRAATALLAGIDGSAEPTA